MGEMIGIEKYPADRGEIAITRSTGNQLSSAKKLGSGIGYSSIRRRHIT
jgi:hypothetical protein